MHRPILWCGLVLLALTPARAEPLAPRVVEETWDAAYLEGAKTGHTHTTVHEIEREGKKLLRTTFAMNLTIKRYNVVVPLRLETTTEETAGGKVVGLSLTQFLDQGRMVQTGRVEGDSLVIRTPGDEEGRRVAWNPSVIGLYKQQHVFQERKVKPGDRFNYLNYELPLLSAVPVRVTVKEPEVVDVLKVKKDGRKTAVERLKQKLLRVEAVADKVEVGGNAIQLPKLVSWLDNDLRVTRSEMEMPGLGRILLYRTTKEVAEEEGVAPALLPDLGLGTLIALKRTIDRPHEARAIVYRITVKGEDDAATTFARDARQEVRNADGNSFELVVRAQREPAEGEAAGEVKPEFLKSNYFLDSDNERIQALAARVAGREADPWRKAQLLEKWVHENMKLSSAVGFNTASQICRDLQGDCRQHALLTAGLCRAAGVPARTAVGLVYVNDPERGPVLGFHMWTEVLVKGQWLGLDATLGQGSIGAGHLKIADSSWAGVQTLAPLLPVTRVLGKTTIEVVRVLK